MFQPKPSKEFFPQIQPELKTVRVSEIPIIATQHFWEKHIVAGGFHLLAGSSGSGANEVANALCAIFSNPALNCPDGSIATHGEVLYITEKHSSKSTLAAQCWANNANSYNIHSAFDVAVPDGGRDFLLTQDVWKIREFLQGNPSVRVVVINPLLPSLPKGRKIQSPAFQDALEDLNQLAKEFNVAIIGVLPAGLGIGRSGSVADAILRAFPFAALCATVMVTATYSLDSDDVDEDSVDLSAPRHVLVPVISNVGPIGSGVLFNIAAVTLPNDVKTVCVEWCGTVEGEPADLLRPQKQTKSSNQAPSRSKDAVNFLKTHLQHGPVSIVQLRALAVDSNMAWRTIERARGAMNLMTVYDSNRAAYWALPGSAESAEVRFSSPVQQPQAYFQQPPFSAQPVAGPVYGVSPFPSQNCGVIGGVGGVGGVGGQNSPNHSATQPSTYTEEYESKVPFDQTPSTHVSINYFDHCLRACIEAIARELKVNPSHIDKKIMDEMISNAPSEVIGYGILDEALNQELQLALHQKNWAQISGISSAS